MILAPLIIAVEKEHPATVALLLDKGSDVTQARADDGATALHIAAAQNDEHTVDLLVKAQANPNLKDNDGRTSMEHAALHHHRDLVRQLAKVQTEPLDFFSAVTLGKAERVQELLKAQPELIKARTRVGGTGWGPLYIAARPSEIYNMAVTLPGRIAELHVQTIRDRDAWAGNDGITSFRRADAEALFDGWTIERFDEEDEEGQACAGPKHWHVFHVSARKAPRETPT